MSLQGPLIVVADSPAVGLGAALSAAGAFPIVETKWVDAPTAFVSVKPAAVIIAEPGVPKSESSARMLCLQIATATSPIVPVIAHVCGDQGAAVPIALPVDMAQPIERLIARLQSALRVRALHATVLRRIETVATHDGDGKLPPFPVGDALEDATVLVAGRGPRYAQLGVAMAEKVQMLGALSVEIAAKHLDARDIDGIVLADGFSQRMMDEFLTMLAQDNRFRDIPIAVIGDVAPEYAEALPYIDQIDGDAAHIVARMLPLVRLHAFSVRLKRMMKTLDTEGMFDPDTGLLTWHAFWQELQQTIAEVSERSTPVSLARFSFDGPRDRRVSKHGARLMARLIRNIDFACRQDDGGILVAFAQTDLRDAHVAARRIAGVIKKAMLMPRQAGNKITANVTLATFKAGDTLQKLMLRVMGGAAVAAK